MVLVKVKDEVYGLLYDRAKREGKKVEVLVHELLSPALWNEPGLLFRGKYCQVNPELFTDFTQAVPD